jgi:hypothetical protein
LLVSYPSYRYILTVFLGLLRVPVPTYCVFFK